MNSGISKLKIYCRICTSCLYYVEYVHIPVEIRSSVIKVETPLAEPMLFVGLKIVVPVLSMCSKSVL